MSSDTETEEMNFTAYASHTEKIYKILVAGGGLQNGNACAYVEFPLEAPNKIVYAEYTIGKERVNVVEEKDSILIFEKLDEDDYNYDNFSIVKYHKATEEQRDIYTNFIDMINLDDY